MWTSSQIQPGQPVKASDLNRLMGRDPNTRISLNEHFSRVLVSANVNNGPNHTQSPAADFHYNSLLRFSNFYNKYFNPSLCTPAGVAYAWQSENYYASEVNSHRKIYPLDYFPGMQAGDKFTIVMACDNQFAATSGNQLAYAGFTFGTDAGFLQVLNSFNKTSYNFNMSGAVSNQTTHLSFYYDGGLAVDLFPHYRYNGTITSAEQARAYIVGIIFMMLRQLYIYSQN